MSDKTLQKLAVAVRTFVEDWQPSHGGYRYVPYYAFRSLVAALREVEAEDKIEFISAGKADNGETKYLDITISTNGPSLLNDLGIYNLRVGP
jgi:hypothetical protein